MNRLKTAVFAIAFIMMNFGCNPLGSSSSQSTGFHPGQNSPPPKITSISPSTGPLQGGTLLTINGSFFQSGATVSLGGAACAPVSFVSANQLTCTTGIHGAAVVSVTVTNPDTQGATLASIFAYEGSPMPVAGFAHVSGGNISTGAGVRLRSTSGAVGNPAQPSGAGVKLNAGIQGALTQP